MSKRGTTAKKPFAAASFAVGVDDFVSLADVQGLIDDGGLAESLVERQRLVDTVRSLVKDGPIEVGVIPSPNNPGFKPWPGTLNEVMTRLPTASSDTTTIDLGVGCFGG